MDNRKRRLMYRATHCGMKENDRLLGGFATAALEAMSEAELDAFEAVMRESDNDLYNWITGKEDAPAHVPADMLGRIKAHHGFQ